MKEKYHYKSDWYYLAGFGFIASAFFFPFLVMGVALELYDYYKEVTLIFFIVWLGGAGAILYLLGHMPASFQANAEAVDFSLLFRKIHIPYSDISSIEVKRYYAKALIRGDVPHYVEEMHIVCGDTAYDFHAPMQIDMDDAAMHPEKLQEQFENGIFRRLQHYIESQGISI